VRELHIHELQQHLLLQDVYLPGFQVDAAINLARQAKLSASGEAALVFPKPRQYKPADTVLCQAFFAKEIQKVILPLYNDGSEPIDVSLELHIGKQLDLFVETSPVKTVHAVLPAGKHLIAFEFSCSFGSEKCCRRRSTCTGVFRRMSLRQPKWRRARVALSAGDVEPFAWSWSR
jgi:hypothetical protein